MADRSPSEIPFARASGNRGRAKLPRELSETLDPYVRAKYEELWQAAQRPDEDY